MYGALKLPTIGAEGEGEGDGDGGGGGRGLVSTLRYNRTQFSIATKNAKDHVPDVKVAPEVRGKFSHKLARFRPIIALPKIFLCSRASGGGGSELEAVEGRGWGGRLGWSGKTKAEPQSPGAW